MTDCAVVCCPFCLNYRCEIDKEEYPNFICHTDVNVNIFGKKRAEK